MAKPRQSLMPTSPARPDQVIGTRSFTKFRSWNSKEAFKEVAQLPEDEQRYIVEIIRQGIASEKRWQTLFQDPRSERVLENLVAEALAEDAVRETEEIRGETFLS